MSQISIFQKYKFLHPLGKGGCGTVYLAQNLVLGNLWAVKEIDKEKNTPLSVYIEPEILKRLNHPALPRICDIYDQDNKLYIIEDYIEGENLKSRLDREKSFDAQTVTDWAIQLCNVLGYLHQQKPQPIIYGDMKPQNIIITKDNFIKLIDFGVSAFIKEGESETSPQDTVFIGTRGYAPPEQFTGAGLDFTSDIFSLGVTMLQLLTGKDPIQCTADFSSGNLTENIPPGLVNIIMKCIAFNRNDRFQTAQVLASELMLISRQSKSEDSTGSNLKQKPATFGFSKIIGVTGISGTGITTISLALAEYAASKGINTCLVDMSSNERLSKSTFRQDKHLHYVNFAAVEVELLQNKTDSLALQNWLNTLLEKYTLVVLDIGSQHFGAVAQFIYHIYFISDMNPFNISQLDIVMAGCRANHSIIINKYCSGEFKISELVNSICKVPSNYNIHTLPCQQEVYLMWVRSYLGEPLGFKKLDRTPFWNTISKISSEKISKHNIKRKGWFHI